MSFSAALLLFSFIANARVDFSDCSGAVSMDLIATGQESIMVMDDPIFVLKNGKIEVRKKDSVIDQKLEQNKEEYVYNLELTPGIFEKRKLKVSKNGGNYSIRHEYDPRQQDKARRKVLEESGVPYTELPEKTKAKENIYSLNGKDCSFSQSSTTVEWGGRERTHVSWDQVFCDRAKDILNKHGKTKVEQCAGVLAELNEAYLTRDAELNKEKKTLRESIVRSGFFPKGMQDMTGGLVATTMCAPPEWQISLTDYIGFSSAQPVPLKKDAGKKPGEP